MVLRTLSVLVLMLAATGAQALSCLRPDAVSLYERARDSEDVYVIVRGEIAITGPVNEANPETGKPGLTLSRISGAMLTPEGFGAPFERDVTIVSTCAGPWCGSATGQEGLLISAIKMNEDGLTLDSGPCGGDMVGYDGDAAARMLTCHRFGKCEISTDF